MCDNVKLIKDSDRPSISLDNSEPCTIIFKCESVDDARVYANAFRYKDAFEEVWMKLFRPRLKHGYNSKKINDLLERNGSEDKDGDFSSPCHELMDELEKLYHEIREDIQE